MSPFELNSIPGLKLDDDEPVFAEPWEAQAFALVVGLHEKGAFTWEEWAQTLGRIIAEDHGSAPYFQLWLDALQVMVRSKALLSDDEMRDRCKEWEAAVANTPHGQPIELDGTHR